ncbi:nickel/cobalt transporter [Paracoccus sp. R86501]|uniref:nickel/cobalt transporter n=1 Tax=Paracoccus sp. R86501 TaxID=3101711 RepID=UPI00366F5DA7
MSVTPIRAITLTGLAVALILAALWFAGGFEGVQNWAALQQRQAQNLMAGSLRALRSGQPGALLGLMGVCFGYGFLHAVGPGHGKLVIGSYGFGTQVPMGRLALLSVLSSLAQAGTAIALVWGGITFLNLTREALTDLTEDHMATLSTALIALIGLWLAWRGARMLMARPAHHHHHDHGPDCGCGHAHGPTPQQAAQTRSWRDAILLIAGIAARPCTGALFLLILTWRMQIFGAGVLGTLAMGLGTASVTLAVAGLAVWARQGSFALFPQSGPLARAGQWLPGVMQLGAGLLIAAVSAAILF